MKHVLPCCTSLSDSPFTVPYKSLVEPVLVAHFLITVIRRFSYYFEDRYTILALLSLLRKFYIRMVELKSSVSSYLTVKFNLKMWNKENILQCFHKKIHYKTREEKIILIVPNSPKSPVRLHHNYLFAHLYFHTVALNDCVTRVQITSIVIHKL